MSNTKQRCEGYRRYGGAFSFGPAQWVQCKEDATVTLEVEQGGNTETLPACVTCWNEAIENKLNIIEARPIAQAKEGQQ